MDLITNKFRKDLINNLIKPRIPSDIKVYIEPFGGYFNVFKQLDYRPELVIYNDIKTYDTEIPADLILHKDYKEIINEFDSVDAFFYFDPPYYKKEHYYGLKYKDDKWHMEFCNIIKNLKGRFIISYEDCNFIRHLYKDFNVYNYNGIKTYLKTEIIITKKHE